MPSVLALAVQGEHRELFLSVSSPAVTQNSGSVIGDTVVEIKSIKCLPFDWWTRPNGREKKTQEEKKKIILLTVWTKFWQNDTLIFYSFSKVLTVKFSNVLRVKSWKVATVKFGKALTVKF